MLSSVRSMNAPWLNDGMMIESEGQFIATPADKRDQTPFCPLQPPPTCAGPAAHAERELVDVAARGFVPDVSVELLRRVVERAGEAEIRLVIVRSSQLQLGQPRAEI